MSSKTSHQPDRDLFDEFLNGIKQKTEDYLFLSSFDDLPSSAHEQNHLSQRPTSFSHSSPTSSLISADQQQSRRRNSLPRGSSTIHYSPHAMPNGNRPTAVAAQTLKQMAVQHQQRIIGHQQQYINHSNGAYSTYPYTENSTRQYYQQSQTVSESTTHVDPVSEEGLKHFIWIPSIAFRRRTIPRQCTILLTQPTAIQANLQHTQRCTGCRIIPIRLHRHSISNPWQALPIRRTVFHPPLLLLRLLLFTVKTIICLSSTCNIDSVRSLSGHPFSVYVQLFFSPAQAKRSRADCFHVLVWKQKSDSPRYIYTIELCAIGTTMMLTSRPIYLPLFSKNANKFLLIVFFSSVIFDLSLSLHIFGLLFAFLR